MDIKNLTIKEASLLLRKKEITSVELANLCLKNIEEKNKDLNIFLEVFDDVLEQAKKADEMISKGEGNEMTGIPIAIKDNILIQGHKVSAGSKMLENYVATYDAFVIKKLKQVGAVFLGRVNMDEFAMGSSTENSAYGVVKNPIDPSRVPGGSSGGSSASVASGMALASLGSDTGGSIRQPASFCGLVGMKPTYGLVSRSGLMAMSSSLDQIGPITKTVEDAQIIFDCIVGKDEMDATNLHLNIVSKKEEISNLKKIGVPRNWLKEGVDVEVMQNFQESLDKLKNKGYEIIDIDLPYSVFSLAVYYILMPAEVSTNLSRLDGIRYGMRKEGSDMLDTFKKSRTNGFGLETRRRIILGTYVLSHGYYDAYYNKAWKVRHQIEKEFKNIFEKVDFIATPTTPTTAFKFGEKKNPLQMYLSDIFTVPSNISGCPSISVPSGFDKNGLPFGIQFMADNFLDEKLFSIAKDLE
jgi:aspartyl-tRNA(Asn)/glutamyl-tRNA(Gln) amidotransferase subunit A